MTHAHIHIYYICCASTYQISVYSLVRDLVTPIDTEIRVTFLMKRNPIWLEAEEEMTQEMRKGRRETWQCQ